MSSYSIMPAFMAATEYLPKKQKAMEKSCIWNIKPVKKERKLPKSWKAFCEMFPIKEGESYINEISAIVERDDNLNRLPDCDRNVLPDSATAEAVLTLMRLIQLRNCYNGDWVPDWNDEKPKYLIEFLGTGEIGETCYIYPSSPLYFKSEELCDEFLRHFRPLIEKLKPLYGIKSNN